MAVKCGPATLTRALARIKREYGDEVEKKIQEDLTYAGEYAAGELARTSPRESGIYAKGWDYRFLARKGVLTVQVGNITRPTLSHLLEKGHAISSESMLHRAGWSPPKKHIEPGFDATVEVLERRLYG